MKLGLVIAATCGIAVAAPAYARQDPPQTAAVQATGTNAATYAWSSNDITIAAGGTVTFSNPTNGFHDVAFSAGSPSCSGLPAAPGSQWPAGSCRFDAPGTYTYFCEVHSYMTGTIRVVAPPAPTATATPGATATPQPGGSNPGPPPSGGGSQATVQSTLAVTLPKSQEGTRVRGSVNVTQAGSRLEVGLWAERRSLAGTSKSSKLVRIGKLTRAKAPAGKVSFAVGTDAKAKSALRRHHRLSVTVSIALTPPGGHKLTRSVKRTLRAG